MYIYDIVIFMYIYIYLYALYYIYIKILYVYSTVTWMHIPDDVPLKSPPGVAIYLISGPD